MTHRSAAPALDLSLPARRELSLALVLVRRMAMKGPDDSRAAMLALDNAAAGHLGHDRIVVHWDCLRKVPLGIFMTNQMKVSACSARNTPNDTW